MPKWFRLVVTAVVIVVTASPVVIAPGLAESYGLERSTGSTIGALVSIVLFMAAGAGSIRIIRHREQRQVGTERGQLLKRHRKDGTNN